MTVNEIIQRAADGEILSDEERNELKNFQSNDELQNQLNNIIAERDQLQFNLAELNNQNTINKIAAKYQFTDSEYLAFKFNKNGIAPDSDEAIEFMDSLKNELPKLFKLDIAPGVPTPTPISNNVNTYSTSPADELTRMLANAPEIK